MLNIELSSDPANVSTGVFPKKKKETYVCIKFYTQKFIVLSTAAKKIWKQYKSPPTKKWINKMWYMHTM